MQTSRLRWVGCAAALAAALAGCGGGAPAGSGSGGQASTLRLEFWHTRQGDQEKLLQEICREYGQAHHGVTIDPQYQGSYDELNKKLRASIQGGALPAMAVAYESQVAEYMANGAVRPLDDLVTDPEVGYSPSELEDIPPSYLESNRFPRYDNQLLSFPFTKSHLVLYANRTLLREAGFEALPATWQEFETQSAAVSAKIGSPALAFRIDPSTLAGMIFSHGGELVDQRGETTRFDQEPTVATLELLQRMARNKSLAETSRDNTWPLLISRRAAFILETSSSRAELEKLIGDQFELDVASIPRREGVDPVTVQYGPNICLFKTNPEQERAAWSFVRYFTSPEVTARWSRETGYLPVRRSAAELPEMQAFFQQNPRARRIYEILPVAKGEPNVVGWQEVRALLDTAARSAIAGGTSPQAIAVDLKRKADQALAGSR